MKRLLMMVILLLVTLTASVCAAADGELTVRMPETVNGYAEQTIVIDCPWEGEMTCSIHREGGALLYEMKPVNVAAGVNEVVWDGLGAWDQPIDKGSCFVRCTLVGGNGSISAEAGFEMGNPEQALVFALPSSPTFSHDGETWYLTYKLVRSGTVVIEVWQDGVNDAPVLTFNKRASDDKPTIWKWPGTLKGKPLPDGDYTMRVYTEDNPAYMEEIHVTIDNSSRTPDVDITGKIIPDGEEDVPACAAAPAVVASERKEDTVKIYTQPKTNSKVLGRVDCDVQCLEVHSIEGKWAEVTAYRQEDGAQVRGYCQLSKMEIAPIHDEYVLVVNREDGEMTVWQHGTLIGSVPVTLGGAAEDHPEYETISGAFIVDKRASTVSTGNGRFSYGIRIGDSFTMYQADPSVHKGLTNGDIAVAGTTDEESLSAYWLWTHIPPNTRVIIRDDPRGRINRIVCAAAGLTYDPEGWTVYEPVALQEGESEIIMTFGGDVALGTREKWMGQKVAFPAYLREHGMAYPLSGMVELFSGDDMTLVNLEAVLKDNGKGENENRLVRLRGLPEWVEVLHLGSIEQVNVANNHHQDYGEAGVESTIATLNEAQMPYSGFGATYIAEINGHKIGFGGCREAWWLQGKQDIAGEIASLRESGCEVIVYSCHWGTEYSPVHSETQKDMAEEVIDAGADFIIGHHPHVVQGIDVIDGVPVLYSLGNLMFGGTHDMKTFDGAVARVHLRFDDEGYVGASVTMIPVLTSTRSQEWVNDYHPVPATGEDALRILAKIQADSSVKIEEEMFFPAR